MSRVDLRPAFPRPDDQGSLQSCTALALAAAVGFAANKPRSDLLEPGCGYHPWAFRPSALFIYYNQRLLAQTPAQNAAVHLETGLESLASFGACSEDRWPYVVANFDRRPPPRAYKEAQHLLPLHARSLRHDLADLKACLAEGYPFLFGFRLAPRWTYRFAYGDIARSGQMPLFSPDELSAAGHAALVVGYDDEKERFLARNSLGERWGQAGYFTLPYELMASRRFIVPASLWTLRSAATEPASPDSFPIEIGGSHARS